MLKLQSLCKMAGGTRRVRWQLHATLAGRMKKKAAVCGTAQVPKEVAHLGDKEAMEAGLKATQ